MLLRISCVASALLLAVACGSTSPTEPSSTGSGAGESAAGTMTVRITDNPYDAARAVFITFSDVSVLRGSTWTKVPFPGGASSWTCDLKKLQNGHEDVLATGSVAHADYTMVRLTVQSATVYTDNVSTAATPCAQSIPAPAGAARTMTLASNEGQTNGVFSINSNTGATIVLDFDGESSIAEPNPNQFVLTPVVRLVTVR